MQPDAERPDLLNLDDLLTDEERAVRDAVARFVDEEVRPIAAEHFERGSFPMDLVPRLAELGLLGANLSGYGCPGLGEVAYGLAMQELERGDSGVRSFASVQGALAMYPIWRYGSEEQKERYLPEMAAGRLIGCFGLTEPDAGSNPGGMQTRAVRTSGGFRIDGVKRWITNGHVAQLAVVWAKLDGEVRGFLVPTDAEGFEARPIPHKWSLRMSVTSELYLEGVEVPEEAMLPKAEGLKAALSCLNQARYGIAWGVLGAAMDCYRTARSYAMERVQFARPLAGYQLVQQKLVAMASGIARGQLLAWRVGRLKEEGRAHHTQISFAKRENVEMALRAARAARDILGANGIVHDYPIGRHLLNLETVYTYEGAHDIHTLILGRHLTGISAFQ